MDLNSLARTLAERLITHRTLRYTASHTHSADYFVYACGRLLWQCGDESTADNIYEHAVIKAEAVIREAIEKTLEEAEQAAINVRKHHPMFSSQDAIDDVLTAIRSLKQSNSGKAEQGIVRKD